MRILIGTLYCGENEYEECVRSLKSQTHNNWTHFVVRDMPNKKAHDRLYELFMKQSESFDLFLKLDADMVLENILMLQKIEDYFVRHPGLDAITICVHDFFSNVAIHGLHVYRSSVRWSNTSERLFVDASPVAPERIRIGVKELAPAASHCKNSTPFFSFHYGVHRGIKARQSRSQRKFRTAANYLQTIEFVSKNFERVSDRRLGLAVLGAELAIDGKYHVEDLDLTNRSLHEKFAEFEKLPVEELRKTVSRIRSQPRMRIVFRRFSILRHRIAGSILAFRGAIWPAIITCIPWKIRHRLRKVVEK